VHNKTQYDDFVGVPISKERFEKETKWKKNLTGQIILEAGSGSGRFTKPALETGAMVVSFDFSNAIEANYSSNGCNPNLLLVQASIYEMPFPENYFDKLFCFGVLQHTPEPQKSFFNLVKFLKPDGKISTDIYAKTLTLWALQTKYYVRPFVKHISSDKLYKYVVRYINVMWPLARLIRKIPKIGYAINWRLLIADYGATLLKGLDDKIIKQMAYLDTFDMLSPEYDKPQTLKTFRKWHEKAGLTDIDVHYGYNGIEARGRKM
jgi:ubiquinone/menaquinone biosynthesis C-methylase UbiE